MDELEQAHHELDRLQGIISRHEGHMFTLRGWLLTIIGGLLTAYYTNNLDITEGKLWTALATVTVAFLLLDLRHLNLVEAAVTRVGVVEELIERRSVRSESKFGWYCGPKVNEACQKGARRLLPVARGMTFGQNQLFYAIVIILISVLVSGLPPRKKSGFDAPIEAHRTANFSPVCSLPFDGHLRFVGRRGLGIDPDGAHW